MPLNLRFEHSCESISRASFASRKSHLMALPSVREKARTPVLTIWTGEEGRVGVRQGYGAV